MLKAKLLCECTTPYTTTKQAASNGITDLMYAKDGKVLICGTALGHLCLFNAADYTLARALPNSIAIVGTLCSSEDGKYCAVIGSVDTLITVYETAGLNEILRIDVCSATTTTNFDSGHGHGFGAKHMQFDTAQRIAFAPYELNQIVCATSANKLLKFDSRNGKLLSAMANMHRQCTSTMLISTDCKFLITTGDNQIKIWDHQMRLDRNYQIFVGHSEPINKVLFTPDYSTLITVGDALFVWDFLAYKNGQTVDMPQGRNLEMHLAPPVNVSDDGRLEPHEDTRTLTVCDRPRTPPIPFANDNNYDNDDQINDTYLEEEHVDDDAYMASEMKKYDSLPNLLTNTVGGDKHRYAFEPCSHGTDDDDDEIVRRDDIICNQTDDDYDGSKIPVELSGPSAYSCEPLPPTSIKHLTMRKKRTQLATHVYTAPSSKCALKFHSTIGFNGTHATTNMLWNPENGFFAYTIGCLIIVEDLKNGKQTPLKGHTEDVTVMALQHDCVCMASASHAACNDEKANNCQVVIWDAINLTRKKTLTHRNCFQINCLSYSKDDRFLLSIGDYRRASLIIWTTYDYTQVASVDRLGHAVHDIGWDPSICNAFVTCGERRTLNFWSLDEQAHNTTLKIHECIVPASLNEIHNSERYEFTCVAYGMEKLLFVGTTHGFVTVWDTVSTTCLLNWSADVNEIASISCLNYQLITGSSSGNLKLWSIQPVFDLRHRPKNKLRNTIDGLIIQKELQLNGAIKCFQFDKLLDIGIVATNKGTLWYINWLEASKIRLVNTHSSRITSICNINDKFISTCSEDGTLRIWSLDDREQMAQFEVKTSVCYPISNLIFTF